MHTTRFWNNFSSRDAQNRKIGKTNNLKAFGSKNNKGPKSAKVKRSYMSKILENSYKDISVFTSYVIIRFHDIKDRLDDVIVTG